MRTTTQRLYRYCNVQRLSLLIAALALFFSACNRPPELPVEPEIEFECVTFKEVANGQDSLIVKINFQDGDGDIGLRGDESGRPYNDVFYFFDSDEELITYSTRSTVPGYDTLPAYEFPYYCTNWIINPTIEVTDVIRGPNGVDFRYTSDVVVEDTVYVQRNTNHFNMDIQYFVQRNGVYEEFDWVTSFEPQCGESFNGRFPVLSDLNDRPLEGTLRYGMTSSGFLFLFRNDTLKLRIQIKDRALNRSNVIETPPFTLLGVRDAGC
jgi:hypothetical protein